MKSVFLTLCLIASFAAHAEDKSLLFVGVTESGENCSLTSYLQEGIVSSLHLQLKGESFHFYNTAYQHDGPIQGTISGYFENHAPDYVTVIGAPVLGMGGYVRMNLKAEYSTQGLESLSIERIDQFAYVFGVMETGRTKIFCQ